MPKSPGGPGGNPAGSGSCGQGGGWGRLAAERRGMCDGGIQGGHVMGEGGPEGAVSGATGHADATAEPVGPGKRSKALSEQRKGQRENKTVSSLPSMNAPVPCPGTSSPPARPGWPDPAASLRGSCWPGGALRRVLPRHRSSLPPVSRTRPRAAWKRRGGARARLRGLDEPQRGGRNLMMDLPPGPQRAAQARVAARPPAWTQPVPNEGALERRCVRCRVGACAVLLSPPAAGQHPERRSDRAPRASPIGHILDR